MSSKIFIPNGQAAPPSQIGATIETLCNTINDRKLNDSTQESYTQELLASVDKPLKKLVEEACEVGLAAKDVECAVQQGNSNVELSKACDHLRYEAGDVMYHLLVILAKYGISAGELAAEMNMRMQECERPAGGVLLHNEFVNRGK